MYIYIQMHHIWMHMYTCASVCFSCACIYIYTHIKEWSCFCKSSGVLQCRILKQVYT